MNLKNPFTDDDSAVSPVIGVILMVAITVILAAVIATFVLGLGDSADEVQPNTSFNFDYENYSNPGGVVTVTLADGENLAQEEVFIRGTDIPNSGKLSNINNWTSGGGGASSGVSANDQWDAGETVDIEVDSEEYVLNVVWESVDSDDSSTLQTDEGPDA